LISDIPGFPESISQSEPAQAIKNWAQAPSESKTESVGYGIGSVAPYVVGDPVADVGKAAQIGLGALRGGASEFVQPTEEGTAWSHLKGVPAGAALGAVPGVGTATIHILATTLRAMGFPIPHIPHIIRMLYTHGRRAANSQAARNMQQNIYQSGGGTMLDAAARRVKPGLSSALGVGTGQAFGPGVQPDAESQ
jgi:hypothetical protein